MPDLQPSAPQPGDLLRDASGDLWFAYEAAFCDPQFNDELRLLDGPFPVRVVDHQGNRTALEDASLWHGPFSLVHRDLQADLMIERAHRDQEHERIAEILNELRAAQMNEDSYGVSEAIGRISEIVRHESRVPFQRTTKTIGEQRDGGESRG